MGRLRIGGFAVALLVALLSAGAAPVSAAPPATNDAFANAKLISPGALPYTDEVDATAATTEGPRSRRSATAR